MKKRTRVLKEKFHSRGPSAKARLVLAVIGGLLLACLLAAKKPWAIDLPSSGPWKLSHYVAVYVWIGLLINLFITALLAFTASWWTRPLAEQPGHRTPSPRWFWPLVAVAMAVNAGICWPRLWQSFWHDENYPLRNAIVGVYRQQPDGSLSLKPVPWQATFFFYKKPNHTFYSGLARACNELWLWVARPKGLPFSEPIIRLPAYVAGIASIATIALLLEELEFPLAGVLAALLSALHPWHIRYASEARAYAFVLCLLPLLFFFFLRAIKDGRWCWWAAFSAGTFLLLYSYPTCIYVLIVLNLCALPAIWWQWKKPADALTQIMRLAVANIVAAMLFLPLMLPCVPQFLDYVKGTPGQGQLDSEWVINFLAHLLGGIPWGYRGHVENDSLELFRWFSVHPLLEGAVVIVAVILLLAGIFRLVRRDRLSALLPVMFLLPAVICFAETKLRGLFINEWYLLFALPGVIALIALGLDQFAALVESGAGKVPAIVLVALVVSSFAAWSAPQRNFLMTRSLQPNRESVLLARAGLNPNDPRQKEVLTATFYGPPEPYDPNIIVFRNAVELGELVRRADAEGKALYINLGYLTTVEGEHENKYAFLRNSGFFEDLGILSGFEPTLQSRHVFRYIPGSAASFDFSTIPSDRGRPGTGLSY